MREQNKLALVYFMSITLTASSTRKQRIKPPKYLGVSRFKTSVSDYEKVSFTLYNLMESKSVSLLAEMVARNLYRHS